MKTKLINDLYDKIFDNDTMADFMEFFPDAFIDNEQGIIYLLNGSWGFKLSIERLN